MKTASKAVFLRPHHVAAGAVFLLLLFRPLYIVFLRHQLKTQMPELWAQLPMNGSFSTLLPELMGSRYGDEALYAARAHQILLHGFPYNPYWRDARKTANWTLDCVVHYIIAAVALVFGGNLVVSWPVTLALVGACWFLLFYRVFYWWCGKDKIAVPLALFSILFPDLYTCLLDINFSPSVTVSRLVEIFAQYQCIVRPYFYRLPSLFLSFLLLCALFVWTWHLCRQHKSRLIMACLVGAGYGLMRFVHPFEYAFAMGTLSVMTVMIWWRPPTPAARRNVSAAFLVSLLAVGIYVWIAMTTWRAAGTMDFAEAVPTHKFFKITIIHLIFATLGYGQLRGEARMERRVAWSLLIATQLAVFALRNTQVILGFSVELLHYIGMGSFFGCLMLFLLLADWLSRQAFWDKKLAMTVCAFIMAWALLNEKSGAEQTCRMCGLPADSEAALQWVNGHLPEDALILTLSMETISLVPLYTRASVQVANPLANFSGPVPKSEYFMRVAQLLKTCHVNVDAFIRDRWLLADEKERVRGEVAKKQYYMQQVDTNAMEGAFWFYPLHSESHQDQIPVDQERLRSLVKTAPPISGPYYIWINAKDRYLLTQPPESYGAKLAYQNPSVSIYAAAGR